MFKRVGIGLLVGGLLVAIPGTGAFGTDRRDGRETPPAERSRRDGKQADDDRREAREGRQDRDNRQDRANRQDRGKRNDDHRGDERDRDIRRDRHDREGRDRPDRRDHDRRHWDERQHRYYYYRHRGPHGPGYYDYCGYYHGPDGQAGPYECRYYDGWEPTGSFVANMSADQEVPAPGPDGASGVAYVDVDPDAGRLCYSLDYDGPQATDGYVQQGAARRTGPVVVDLGLAAHGEQGCVPADRRVLHDIARYPGAFYVDLRSADYPAGMMRGQLQRTS